MTSFKRIVGLTGGMGSGKSTLVKVARDRGLSVFDWDDAVRMSYLNENIGAQLRQAFGLQDVQKARVAEFITSNPDKLEHLSEIFRPIMWKHFCLFKATRVNLKPREDHSFGLLDMPLLFEEDWRSECDYIVSITCPREIRERRVMTRSLMTREKMTLMMDNQVTDEYRIENSDFVIDNVGSILEASENFSMILDRIGASYS